MLHPCECLSFSMLDLMRATTAQLKAMLLMVDSADQGQWFLRCHGIGPVHPPDCGSPSSGHTCATDPEVASDPGAKGWADSSVHVRDYVSGVSSGLKRVRACQTEKRTSVCGCTIAVIVYSKGYDPNSKDITWYESRMRNVMSSPWLEDLDGNRCDTARYLRSKTDRDTQFYHSPPLPLLSTPLV